MADRLQELLQQRALIKEHLAWLESEIAAASGQPRLSSVATSRPTPAAAAAAPASPITVPRPPAPTAGDAEAEALLAKFALQEGHAVPPPNKRGCWMAFSTVLLILVGVAMGLIYFFYR